jgi:hypothetical protein
MRTIKVFLKRFFLNYCWIGIIIILLMIILDLKSPTQTLPLKVFIEFFKTIGISIIVASVFTWASDSYAFVDKIQELLKSVVVKRDFLSNLDADSKMDAIRSLIKPSSFERKVYTNIDDYYDFYIKKTMRMSEKNVRSDYNVNSRIYFDTEKNLVVCEKIVNYRLYPTMKGFEIIKIGFSDLRSSGKIDYVRIYKPNGEVVELKGEKIELKETIFDGEKMKIASIDMNSFTEKDKHLGVEFKILEYGYDHWIMAAIQTLQPTDGISYKIRCEDGIKIITSDTFGQGVNFKIDKYNNDTEISISTYQWLNEGAGIAIIASK